MKLRKAAFTAVSILALFSIAGCGATGTSKKTASGAEVSSSRAEALSARQSSSAQSMSDGSSPGASSDAFSSKASPVSSAASSEASSAAASSQAPENPAVQKNNDAESVNRYPIGTIREPVITDAMRALSNKSYGTGANENDRDENNVPNGYIYYMNKWGKDYDAKWLTDTSVKELHLTFDEGYETGNTPAILDVLKEKNIKATFFITKYFADTQPELVRRIIDEGHTLGNHTCAHPEDGMPSLSLEAQAADVLKLENQIRSDFGYEMKFFRYPEGEFSDRSLALMNDMGFTCIFWSFAHKDWDVNNQPDPAESLEKMKDRLHPGAIYLLHGVSTTDTEVLPALIDFAREQGYSIKPF